MNSWNYRVVKTEQGLSIYEIFYDKDGKPESRTLEPVLNFHLDSVQDIVYELEQRIRLACDQPILMDKEIGKKKDI